MNKFNKFLLAALMSGMCNTPFAACAFSMVPSFYSEQLSQLSAKVSPSLFNFQQAVTQAGSQYVSTLSQDPGLASLGIIGGHYLYNGMAGLFNRFTKKNILSPVMQKAAHTASWIGCMGAGGFVGVRLFPQMFQCVKPGFFETVKPYVAPALMVAGLWQLDQLSKKNAALVKERDKLSKEQKSNNVTYSTTLKNYILNLDQLTKENETLNQQIKETASRLEEIGSQLQDVTKALEAANSEKRELLEAATAAATEEYNQLIVDFFYQRLMKKIAHILPNLSVTIKKTRKNDTEQSLVIQEMTLEDIQVLSLKDFKKLRKMIVTGPVSDDVEIEVANASRDRAGVSG